MKKVLLYIFLLLLPACFLSAQRTVADRQGRSSSARVKSGGGGHFGTQENDDEHGRGRGNSDDKKNKEPELPTGLKTWKADPRFGVVDSVVVDTMPHYFQNECYSQGIRWQHNTMGNLGSPRISRLLADRPLGFSYFIFAEPYDFFLTPFSSIHFTNTKSPITNITYHETTGKETGEDHIKALYAVNAGKDIGLGLKLDYLYGRGNYNAQSTSNFNATLFGSIMKERYKAHFFFYTNYLKTAENGGITDDSYVTHPENFPSKFDTRDIPTRLSKVWNKMHVDGLQWTHRYSMGFYKNIPLDSLELDSLRKLKASEDLFAGMATKTPADTLKIDSTQEFTKKMFVPVTSVIHTLKFQSNERHLIANEKLNTFYTHKYYEGDSTLDKTTNTYVSNMVSVELHEGFNKWAMAGIRLFGIHDFNHYKMPISRVAFKGYTENEFTLGGQLFKEAGKHLGYHLTAETTSSGDSWGEFKISGDAQYKVKFLGDSLKANLVGDIINKRPTFFYRHFTSQYLSWDNDLDKQFTTRIGGRLQCDRTHTVLSADVRNIKNYTYFANTSVPISGSQYPYTYNTEVRQSSAAIQLLSLQLNQDFRLGPLNWENQVTYQECSKQNVLPTPKFNLYSNLYLLFHVAKVLRVEFGGDVRWFSSYYAPTYSPVIGMFTLQAEDDHIKIGDYPIVNVYANFHLKHTRFYVMAEHVNYSRDGKGSKFLIPHYPINPMTIHLGLSWNFFN